MPSSSSAGKIPRHLLVFLPMVLFVFVLTFRRLDFIKDDTTQRQLLFVDFSSSLRRQQQQRQVLKYFETYRYVLPATRDFNYHVLPAEECGVGPAFDMYFRQDISVRSHHGEDKFIYRTFFQNQFDSLTASNNNNKSSTTGTYVELGAFDGSTESNTRFFDKCLGWKGLLIEGNPDSYQKVLANRPFAHKMSLAPSCGSADKLQPTNSTVEFYHDTKPMAGLVGKALTNRGQPTVQVPCGPLGPILQHVFGNGGEILFFSLDVEGAERLVLDTIDFTKVLIHVLMIEVINSNCRAKANCKVRNDVRQRMQDVGYLRYEGLVDASDIYVHPDSPFQMPSQMKR